MENSYLQLNNDFKEVFGKTTATVECNIDAQAKGGVGKLLSVTANVKSASVDKNGDSARVSATLNCKVIFLNKAGEYDNFDYLCDFSAMVNSETATMALQQFSHLWAVCDVVDIDSSVVGDLIKTQSVVNICVFGVFSNESVCLASVGGEVLCKRQGVIAQTLLLCPFKAFESEESFDTGCTVEKILFYDANTIVTNAKTEEGKVIVSGNVCGNIVYLSEGIVTCKNFNTPFAEDIVAEGICESDKADFGATISDCKIVLTGLEGDNVILLNLQISLHGLVFKQERKEIISDIFSPSYCLETERTSCNYNVFEKSHSFFDKIVGSAKINDDMVVASKIIATTLCHNMIANCYYDEGKLVVEGALACNVIYQDVEGAIQSILIELPYSLQFEDNFDGKMQQINAFAVEDGLFAKLKRDREFEVTANMCISTSWACKTSEQCVKEVTLGDKKNADSFGLVVYICQPNDDLWNVAKAIGADMNEILAQNPNLGDDLTGKKVLFYRQISN